MKIDIQTVMFGWVDEKLLSIKDYKNAESALFQAYISLERWSKQDKPYPFLKEIRKIYQINVVFPRFDSPENADTRTLI